MAEPKYRFDASLGQLFFSSGRTEIVVGDIDLAVAWTTDEDGNGCLHQHGSSQKVLEKADLIRKVDDTVKTAVIPWEAIKHPEMGPKIIDEVNNCLTISGRVIKLEGLLQEMSGMYAVEIIPK